MSFVFNIIGRRRRNEARIEMAVEFHEVIFVNNNNMGEEKIK